MEEARDNSDIGFGKSQEQKGDYSGSKKRQKESPLGYIDGHMSPQKAELAPKLQKYRGRVVLGGEIKDDSWRAYAVFTEQGSSASQMTASKFMDGQAADAVSACSQIAQNSKIRMSRRMDTSSATQMAKIMGQN